MATGRFTVSRHGRRIGWKTVPSRSLASRPNGAPPANRSAPTKGAPGRAQLYIDKRLVGQIEMPVTTPIAFNPGGMTCGANPGSAVTPDYQAPFRFTGTLHTVTIDISGDLIVDAASEMRMHMARQ